MNKILTASVLALSFASAPVLAFDASRGVPVESPSVTQTVIPDWVQVVYGRNSGLFRHCERFLRDRQTVFAGAKVEDCVAEHLKLNQVSNDRSIQPGPFLVVDLTRNASADIQARRETRQAAQAEEVAQAQVAWEEENLPNTTARISHLEGVVTQLDQVVAAVPSTIEGQVQAAIMAAFADGSPALNAEREAREAGLSALRTQVDANTTRIDAHEERITSLEQSGISADIPADVLSRLTAVEEDSSETARAFMRLFNKVGDLEEAVFELRRPAQVSSLSD